MTDKHNRESLDITAIVCTYNRADSLAKTLESLAASELAGSTTWEVLVVDNNSTDITRDVVEGFCRRYPGRFRYLFEPAPGKSYALNAAVANARGEVLAFVDDDVTVEATWLQNLTAELRGREWAGAGGRVLPAQAFTPPPWLAWDDCVYWKRGGGFRWDPLAIVFGHFDLGDQPGKLDINRPPTGGNMAFRKSVFEKYGGFRLDLGPSPNRDVPHASEDTEFGRRLAEAGECLRYEPSAVVYHPVLPYRVNKDYFLSYWFDLGRATIRERGDRPAVHGIPWDCLSLMQRVINLSLASVRGIFAFRSDKRFFFKCMVWMEIGMIAELYHRLADHKVSQAVAL